MVKVVAGRGVKLWWKCRKCGYEWQATRASRRKGHGCPRCARQIAA